MTPELEALERLKHVFKVTVYNFETELEQLSRRTESAHLAMFHVKDCIASVEAEITKLKEGAKLAQEGGE